MKAFDRWFAKNAPEDASEELRLAAEAGLKARPCNVESVRGIVAQCKGAGVPVFVKQLGSNCKGSAGADYTTKYPKGGDPSEWPEDLRIREFPI